MSFVESWPREELLDALEKEREKFSQADDALLHLYVDELVRRGVYPTDWPEPGPFGRMEGWGARWHLYGAPHRCRVCSVDLCDRSWGPPGKREIGIVEKDYVVRYRCPDCSSEWPSSRWEPEPGL